MYLNSIDRAILRFLLRYGRWATTNHVADRSGIAWATAEKHLEELAQHGYVIKGRRGYQTFWRSNG